MKAFCFCLLVFACSGCYIVNVERPVAAGTRSYHRQHFFLLGRIGEYDIDLAKECPQGVAAFGDRFTFVDALFGIATAGIYTPRTVVIQCSL